MTDSASPPKQSVGRPLERLDSARDQGRPPEPFGAPREIEAPPLPPVSSPPEFPAVYRAEFAYVWKTLRRLGVAPSDLEDVSHDLFVVVHRHLADYDSHRPIRPWLFGIAVRVVADYRRAARRVAARLSPDGIADGVDPPRAEEKVAAAEARDLLLKALDTLDLDRRAVFVMHELDDLPVPEIASALGIPLNTAYSRLRLARADVAACAQRLRSREDRRG